MLTWWMMPVPGGTTPGPFLSALSEADLPWSDVRVLPTDLAIAAAALVCLLIVFVLLYKTSFGRQLRAVAEFFRRTEPHSPVAYLADKAAHWGEQPLHVWLRALVKDETAVAHIEEMLGVAERPAP